MSQRESLRTQAMDEGPGLRWFVLRDGALPFPDRGFKTKARASAWIDAHAEAHELDWRVGYLFRLRGDPRDVSIVDRHRNIANP